MGASGVEGSGPDFFAGISLIRSKESSRFGRDAGMIRAASAFSDERALWLKTPSSLYRTTIAANNPNLRAVGSDDIRVLWDDGGETDLDFPLIDVAFCFGARTISRDCLEARDEVSPLEVRASLQSFDISLFRLAASKLASRASSLVIADYAARLHIGEVVRFLGEFREVASPVPDLRFQVFDDFGRDIPECLRREGFTALGSRDESGRAPLVTLTRRGDVARVSIMVRLGANVHERNMPVWTSSVWGAHVGESEPVTLEGAPNLDDEFGARATSLMVAVRAGNLDMVKLLVEAGARLDESDELGTSLMGAIDGGNFQVVKLLVEGGADLEEESSLCGETALMCAAGKESLEMVKLLVEKGAKLEAKERFFRKTTRLRRV
jgi:hypothetical protein